MLRYRVTLTQYERNELAALRLRTPASAMRISP
jgi:hypothetical protein